MNALEFTTKVLERLDLNKKLIVSFCLTALTLISIISFIAINRSKKALEEEIGLNFYHQASNAMDKIDASLFERYGDVQAFATNNLAVQKLQGLDVEESLQDYMNKMAVLYGYYDLMVLVDTQGRIVKTNLIKPDGSEFYDAAYLLWKDESKSEWFKKCISGEIKKGQSYYSEPYFDKDLIRFYKEKIPTMVFAAPVFDNKNKIVGVWANYVNTRKIVGSITQNMIAQNYKKGIKTFQVLIVNKNQKIIDDMQKPEDILVFNFKHKLESINRAVAGVDSFMVEENLRSGKMQINGFALSKGMGGYKGNGWACMTRVETQEAFLPITNLTILLIIVGVILLLLVATITILFAKFMIYDIGRFGNFLSNTTKDVVNGVLDTRGDPKSVGLDFRILVENANLLIESFVKPIKMSADYIDMISKGEMPPLIEEEYKGDFNEIKINLNHAINTINALVADAKMLANAAVDGKLSTRANADKHKGDFKEIIQGVNDTLDSVIGPLNVAAEYVDRISKGDMPPLITDEYHGDFNEIKTNLNQAIISINALVADANMLSKAAVEGKLSTRANADKHQGNFKEIIKGVNDTLDSVIGPLNMAAEYVDRISKGDMPPLITDEYHGDFNEIKTNLNQAIISINALVADANMLSISAVEGKLSIRAKADKHQGKFKAIIDGVNNTLDSVIGPLNVAAEYVDRISKGDLPPLIIDEYNGDFNEIKTNLNQAIITINALVSDANMLAMAAVEGKLSTRANADKHQGDYRKIVQGVNNTLDSVINPLNVAAEYVDRISKGDLPELITDEYNGDFNTIKDNLNQAINAINELVNDSKMLALSAVEGKLSTRANTNKHQGDFKEIIQGVNDTLDSVIGPLNVAAEYVDRISKGDMPPLIIDEYNGDFNEIKTNLNQAITAINALVSDAIMLAQAGKEGRLQTRADASKHQGDFQKIVEGVNNTLDSVINPLNEANNVLAIMANGDLTVTMNGNYNGDMNILKQSINNLSESLRSMISQINESVETTATTSYQMSSNADSLASASQEQAAQADEVASAVEEMSRTVTENAMSAGRTAEVAQKNGEIARDGGKVVEQTVIKMRDIANVVLNSAKNIQKLGESSKEIGEIVSVINDIADQTNLLALNAAIEAARAGEQGRGFAVVADEVRKLAERTTSATKQIASMINAIQKETEGAVVEMNKGSKEVQNGISLADRAGNSLSEIVASSQDVLDMINQIVVASEQQSATSEQISKNVMSISKVTSESTERIEQIAHASEDLTQLTESLKVIVGQFKIVEGNSRNLIGIRGTLVTKRESKQLGSGL